MSTNQDVIDNEMNEWRRSIVVGSEVWWCDPYMGLSSGYYRVDSIHGDAVTDPDNILVLKNGAGSQSEVFAHELFPSQPDDLFPVVSSAGQLCGYVFHREDAMSLLTDPMAMEDDPAVNVRLEELVPLEDGTVLARAWKQVPDRIHVVVSLNVDCDLKGMDADELRAQLHADVDRAIGNGILSGTTQAVVIASSLDAILVEEPVSEDEVADFFLRNIENGSMRLEEVTTIMARYGLMSSGQFHLEMRERLAQESATQHVKH